MKQEIVAKQETPMKIFDEIYPKYKIVSIVGMSKNAGKTVTLNKIISQANEAGVALGLISTGRDGERKDILTKTDKPAILVKKGTIFTTVENLINNNQAGLEILQVTACNTPMGRVILAKAREDVFVEISGPNSSNSIRLMCEEMLANGAELVLIDGSLDRRSSAAPYISEGTILASGAALSRSMNTVIDKTLHIVETYSIEPVEDIEAREIARDIIENGKVGIINKDDSFRYLDLDTSLLSGKEMASEIDDDTAYLVLSGSATGETLKDLVTSVKDNLTLAKDNLLSAKDNLTTAKDNYKVVVRDPTRIFITKKDLLILKRLGLNLRTVDSINIISITINPVAPEGYYFEGEEFLKRMRQAIPNIPVFDVVQGG